MVAKGGVTSSRSFSPRGPSRPGAPRRPRPAHKFGIVRNEGGDDSGFLSGSPGELGFLTDAPSASAQIRNCAPGGRRGEKRDRRARRGRTNPELCGSRSAAEAFSRARRTSNWGFAIQCVPPVAQIRNCAPSERPLTARGRARHTGNVDRVGNGPRSAGGAAVGSAGRPGVRGHSLDTLSQIHQTRAGRGPGAEKRCLCNSCSPASRTPTPRQSTRYSTT